MSHERPATSLVHTPSTSVTHHVASELRLSACVGASLISSCNFVKPDWVTELLRKADLPPDDPDSLENHSNLPNPTKFLPGFHSSVPKALQKKDLWTPNEARIHVFRDLRFLCVGEKSREIDSELRAMIERGGGAIETFNVKDGTAKWRKSLSRGSAKEGQKMVGVADFGAMHAVVGESTWLEFVKEAAEYVLSAHWNRCVDNFYRFNVHFFSAEQLVEVIVKMDVSSLRAGGGTLCPIHYTIVSSLTVQWLRVLSITGIRDSTDRRKRIYSSRGCGSRLASPCKEKGTSSTCNISSTFTGHRLLRGKS